MSDDAEGTATAVDHLDSSVGISGGSSVSHSQTGNNSDGSISSLEKDALRTVLKRLVACPLSDLFLKPVVEFYPEVTQAYLAIVKHPIDLRTVWRRLQSGAYSIRKDGISKIKKDLLNVFSNCILFNGESSNMQLVSVAQHLKMLLSDLIAETGLPLLYPRESEDDIAMRRWKRRRRRYIDCWRIPAQKSVYDAVIECFPEISILPSPQDSVAEGTDRMTFGDVVMEAVQVAGIEYNEVVPSTEDDSRLDDANVVDVGSSSLGRMIDVLFPAPKPANSSSNGSNISDTVVYNDISNVSSKCIESTWESLNEKLSQITISMSEISRRGSELSTIWARPQGLVWAKATRQHGFWPAIIICNDSMPQNIKSVNLKRFPPKLLSRVDFSLKDEINREAESCGVYQGGYMSKINAPWVLVELLGVHDFIWVNGNSSDIRKLTSIEKTPNTKPMRKKLFPTALSEVQRVLDSRDGGCSGLLTDCTLTDYQIDVVMAKAGWNEKIDATVEVPLEEEWDDVEEEEDEEDIQVSILLRSVLAPSSSSTTTFSNSDEPCHDDFTPGGTTLPLNGRTTTRSLQERTRARVCRWLSDQFGPDAFAPPVGAASRLPPEQQALALLRWKAEKEFGYNEEGVNGIAQDVGSNTDTWAQLLDEEAKGRYVRLDNELGSDSATEDEWGADFVMDIEKYMLCTGRKVILRRQLAMMQQLELDLRKRLEEEEIILGPNALKAIKVVEMFEKTSKMNALGTKLPTQGCAAAVPDDTSDGRPSDMDGVD